MSKVSWRPLRHGDRISLVSTFGTGNVYKYRVRIRAHMDPSKAIEENYIPAPRSFINAENEGITWARGWKSNAAKALRAMAAL